MKTEAMALNIDDKHKITFIDIIMLIIILLLAATAFAGDKENNLSVIRSSSVVCNNYAAVISWSAYDDENTNYIIERSPDGTRFSTVGFVQSVAKIGVNQYSMLDETPYNGVSYYRISRLNEENKVVHLNTIVYTPCENEESIEAINGSGNSVDIRINSNTSDTCTVVLMYMGGKTIMSVKHKVSPGLNEFKVQPDLCNGVYVMYIAFSDCRMSKVIRLDNTQYAGL